MTPRRILLFVMLMALAGCAALGMLALFVSSGTVWMLAGTALSTAVASGLLLPVSLLADRPKVRLAGICGMLTVLVCWFMTMVMMWGEMLTGSDTLVWRAFSIFWHTLAVGVPVMFALMMVSFKWGRVATWAFVGVGALAYLLFVVASMLPENSSSFLPFSDLATKLWGTGWVVESLGAVGAALLINLGCGDRRYFRWPGLLLCALGFAIALFGVWADPSEQDWIFRIMALSIIAAVTLAHVNLLLMARLKASQRWLQWGTITFAAVTGFSAAVAVLVGGTEQIEESMLFRLAAAGGIASACGSLALIVLSLFNRNPENAPRLATEFTDILIQCPNCSTRQRLPLGEGSCKVCALQIFVKVVEPRCAGCGYLLYRLQSDRCPECGMPVGKAAAGPAAAAPPVLAANGPATP